MLNQLAKLLNEGESLKFSIERAKDGKLKVMVLPTLTDNAEEVPEEVADMRAALATPLVLTVPADTADAVFTDALSKYQQARQPIKDNFEETLAFLETAGKAASNTKRTVEAKKSGSKPSTEKPKSEDKPADPAKSGVNEAPASEPAAEPSQVVPAVAAGAGKEQQDIFQL